MIAIVDYGAGNLNSVKKAFDYLGAEVMVTDQPATVALAGKIVFPGVGHFSSLQVLDHTGLREALLQSASSGKPFLGICVGMQLMARAGREFGIHKGLGWIDGEVVALTPADPLLKIPHMGWNEITTVQNHPIFAGIDAGAHAYFVHSFELKPDNRSELLATTDYGGPVTAAVGRDNMVGTQFHPEKSQAVGLRLLANFMSWAP